MGSELLLTIDTSAGATSIAISRGESLSGEIFLSTQGSRTDRLLLDAVAKLLDQLELKLESFAAFAAVIGPGSFTGLRVGVATIKGLAMAAGRPVIGISSLRSVAMQACGIQCPVCVLLDARKQEVYAALYQTERGFPVPLGDESVLPPATLLDALAGQFLFVGSGAEVYRSLIEDRLGANAHFLPWPLQVARAGHAAALALDDLRQGKGMSPALLLPHYIRRSEAEIMLFSREVVAT